MPRFADLDRVTRQDIRAFDTDAKKLVDRFHAAGWRSYMSSNSHAIFQAPDGVTTASVSGHNDKAQVRRGRAELDRWLRRNPKKRHKAVNGTTGMPRSSFENHHKHKPEYEPNNEQENDMSTDTTGTYTCPDCKDPDRVFGTGGALALHRQRMHGMTCPECGTQFLGGGNSKRYNAHRFEKHGVVPKKKLAVKSPDGVFPCPWCTAVFGTGQGLAAHSKVHEGQKVGAPAKSEAPAGHADESNGHTSSNGVSSGVEDGLNEHHPARKSTPGDCPVCGDHFTSTNGLNGHMRKHKGKDPEPTPEITPVAVTVPTSVGSTDLEAWIAGQDAGDLLAQVLTIVAAPLVGQVERLRRERDDLTRQVETLARSVEEHEAKMSILKEAMGL